MKKGILFRLLVIVLIGTMLFGMMGFTAVPNDEKDAAQNEEINEPTTGGSGETEEPEDPEEPGEPEEPEEPEVTTGTIDIKAPVGGTLEYKIGETEAVKVTESISLENLEDGTEVSFAVAPDEGIKFVSATVGNAIVADDEFTVKAVKGQTITVSADFLGIKSVKVSGKDAEGNWTWTQSKTVTVDVAGSGYSLAYYTDDEKDAKAVSGNKFEIKDEIGKTAETYTIVATKGDVSVNTTVDVAKIDNTNPVIVSESAGEKITETGYFLGVPYESVVGYKYTVIFSDNLSGLDEASLKINPDNKWANVKSKELLGNVLSFVLDKNTSVGYEIKDKAGNSLNAKSTDNTAPFITKTEVGSGKEVSQNVWWAKPGDFITITATDDHGVESITFGDKTEKATPNGDGEYTADFVIIKSGTFDVTAKDKKNHISNDTKVEIKCDDSAPDITNARFTSATNGDNWLKNAINFITGGILFNEAFDIKFDVSDNDGSGIKSYEYCELKEGTDSVPDDAVWMAPYKTNGTEDEVTGITVKIDKEYRGSIALKVTDNVGNASVAIVEFSEEDGAQHRGKLVTNIATTNDVERSEESFEPTLTVKATSAGADYHSDEDDTNVANWVGSVDFDISAYLGELPEEASVKTQSEDGTETTYEYSFGTPIITVNGDEIPCTQDGSQVTANYTQSDNYVGVLTFEVSCDIKETQTVDGTEKTPTKYGTVSATTTVYVNVQSSIDSATVAINKEPIGNTDEKGWYNGSDNTLNSVVLTAPASAAPFETTYKLMYQPVNPQNGDKPTEVASDSITDISGEIDLTKWFTNAGTYVLTAVSKDCVGNTPTEAEPEIVILYDPNPATINVEFGQDKDYKSTDNKYFDILRTAKVKITDDTFIDDLSEVEEFINLVITKTFGKDASIGEWKFVRDENGIGGSWINENIRYGVKSGEAAKDGDNYQMTIDVVDRAGNKSNTDTSGKYYVNGSDTAEYDDAYQGHKADNFTIDQTKPVVSVSFDNNSALNGIYFAAGRTVTITVNEHNFDASRVKMTATNATSGADAASGWKQSSSDSDVWTKVVVFNPQDATCEFNIEVTDLAGNVCREAEVNYGNSVAHDEFVIDKVNPTLSVTGTNATPYADTCTPGFSGNDTNISSANGRAQYTVQLTRSVRAHRNENVTDKFASGNVTMGADTISAIYANIPDEAENDGIYTLTVSVTDLAGNSSQTASTFTVNRHGSFYIFNEALSDVVNAKYVQKADGKYSVTEYNASPLVSGSVKIDIYRDGQLVKTLTPKVNGGIGDSGLYEYTYDLPAEYFEQDGRYSVSINSEDEAQNKSDNTKLDDAILEFTVDSVAPEIVMIKGLEKNIVNAEELDFNANVIDTYGIADIKIVVDGKVVKEYVAKDVYEQLKKEGKLGDHEYADISDYLDFISEYTLLESNHVQNVEIIATDFAGNTVSTKDDGFQPVYEFNEDILVSTSLFARYIHSPWALILTGVVVVVAAWYFFGKKKDKDDEDANVA